MKKILLSLLFLSTILRAEIIEINQMHEMRSHLKPDTLIIFDIDNCLIEPQQLLGSDQWGSYQIEKYQKEGLSKDEALQKVSFEFISIQNITEVVPVEKTTPAFLKDLQKKNYAIMAVTGRAPEMAALTIKQLASVDIHLSPTAPSKEEILFKSDQTLLKSFPWVLFKEGILFTARMDKGVALFTLLKKLHYTPKRILVIDDKPSCLTQVHESCKERNIPCIGLRYGFTDPKVNNFRSDIAEKQFEAFKKIPSDQEITLLLSKNQIKNN